jgi:predicted phosphodiesterase
MKTLALGQLPSPLMLFGGPYSNLQATTALIKESQRLGIPPGQVICTGDIVAYCGNPEETVSLVRDWGCHIVMGNCEESLAFDKLDCGCGFDEGSVCAELSVDWYNLAAEQVSPENKLWMRGLPRQINFKLDRKNFAVIHGSTENISEFIFDTSCHGKKDRNIDKLQVDCVIGGHSGIPFGQAVNKHYWLNPGVIGMPANDGTSSTWYMLLQIVDETIRASWHKHHFDTREAVRAMAAKGLPAGYQATLETGLWPSMSVLPDDNARRQGIALDPPLLLIA